VSIVQVGELNKVALLSLPELSNAVAPEPSLNFQNPTNPAEPVKFTGGCPD